MVGNDDKASDRASKTPLTKLTREPERGVYEWAQIREILRGGELCHLGVVDEEGQPFVVPTLYALVGDDLLIHGSSASPTLKRAGAGLPVCLTVTHFDGYVLARSVYNHSINYRSVMVFGEAALIADEAEKRALAEQFFETILPGRWSEVRPPSEQEWKAMSMLRLPLAQASAKVRSGPPEDEDADYELDAWAGVVPVTSTLGEPVADPAMRDPGAPTSPAAERLLQLWRGR